MEFKFSKGRKLGSEGHWCISCARDDALVNMNNRHLKFVYQLARKPSITVFDYYPQ